MTLEAALWAALGQFALVVGAFIAWKFRALTKAKWLGIIMAFGAGAIISAVTTDLVAEAYQEAGTKPTGVGLAAGALGFWFITRWLESRGESEHPEAPVERAAEESLDATPQAASATEARNLTIGMILDGIPESIAIGLTLATMGAVSVALVGAVFLAGLPEAIGVAAALLAGGLAARRVFGRMIGIVIIGALSGAIGYAALSQAEPRVIAFIQALAAGAMIVVIVNEMIPIAVRGAGRYAGLAAVAGFAVTAFMSTRG